MNKESTNEMSYEELLCPVMLFRFFIRKQYEKIEISNEECDELRVEFAKYLHSLELTETQKKNILPPSEMNVVMNMDHPLRMHGFPPAYVYHFAEFVQKMIKEAEEEGYYSNERLH